MKNLEILGVLNSILEDNNCSEISDILLDCEKKPKVAEEIKQKINLLAKIFSMYLDLNSYNEPFQPCIALADGRRGLIPQDLDEDDCEFLKELIDSNQIKNSTILSRIEDVLSYRLREYNYGKKAIDDYLSIQLSTDDFQDISKSYFVRSFQIARKFNLKDKVELLKERLLLEFNKDINKDISDKISEVIIGCNLLSSESEELKLIKAKLIVVGDEKFDLKLYQWCQQFYELALSCIVDEFEYSNSEIQCKLSNAIELEADSYYDAGRYPLAHDIYNKAIESYRMICQKDRLNFNVDAKIKILEQKHLNTGSFLLQNLQKNGIRCDGLCDEIEIDNLKSIISDTVKNSQSLYECIWLFVNAGYKFSYFVLKNNAEKACKDMFLSSLFGGIHFSASGRVIAKNNAAFDNYADRVYSKSLWLYKHEVECVTKYQILPFLDTMLQKYSVTKNEIYRICYYSSLVPKNQINSVTKAIWFGFEKDFSTSIHYTASLIETIVRYILHSKNILTTGIRDEIEEEKSLNALFDIKEVKNIFGEDLMFELKAVFTESEGFNLRNDVAHGLVDDSYGYSIGSVYAWWLFLKMIVSFDMKLYIVDK